MPHKRPIIALYAGSFDPITLGHLDVILRAARLFNQLVIGVGQNPDKSPLFTPEERMDMIRPHISRLKNVRAEAYDGLTIQFARKCGARVMLRGIRDATDLANEMQQANVNRRIAAFETVFLMTSDQNVLISSTYIKQICELGRGDPRMIEQLVPRNVARALHEKFAGRVAPGRARSRQS